MIFTNILAQQFYYAIQPIFFFCTAPTYFLFIVQSENNSNLTSLVHQHNKRPEDGA